GSDVLVGSTAHAGALAPGAQFADSVTFELPAWASGAWYVIVQTDSHREVYEGVDEDNNTGFTPVLIQLTDPADLVVSDVTVPGTAVPGEDLSVSWTLSNAGPNPAVGLVRDAIYVSDDTTFQVTDPL